VQRLSAARRLGAGAVDRQVAVGGFSLAAVVLLCAAAFARAPLPAIAVRDPAAARDLVALMRTGERSGWIASYDFTRTLADGRALRQSRREGRSTALHVVVSGTTMTIERRRRSYACTLVGTRYGCKESTVGVTLPASEVLRVAVAIGAYDVIRQPDATIAGLRARCFRVRATGHGGLPGLGVETDSCLTENGISLRRVLVSPPGNVDELIATAVQSRATTRDVEALAERFARNPTPPQR
jgi:hypothetical protein